MEQNISISDSSAEEIKKKVVTSVTFVEDPGSNQYIVQSVDCTLSYGPIIMQTNFKYNGEDREAVRAAAQEFEKTRRVSLGLEKEMKTEGS